MLLKQRYDEIPKLVKTIKGYMKYEKATIVEVLKARGACIQAKGARQQGRAEDMLSGALGKIFALAEKYPDLKANEQFNHLQSRISQIENQIADRREFYKETVNIYNIKIRQLPDVMIAAVLGYRDEQMFEISERERNDVDIDL